MKTDYTIKEISEQLNLSRNTVSKVINEKPGVSKKTQQLVMNFLRTPLKMKPSESEYAALPLQKGSILFCCYLSNNEYFHRVLTGAEHYLKENGYAIVMNILQPDDIASGAELTVLQNSNYSGIISFNVFDEAYWEKIISAGVPSVFIDTFYKPHLFIGKANIIATENSREIHKIISLLIAKGKSRFGFLGCPEYCYSSQMRWQAFQDALTQAGLSVNNQYCILDNFSIYSDFEKNDLIRERIQSMPEYPEAFICTSDAFATILSYTLQDIGYRIPEDIAIVGFDNTSESVRQSPSLTTIDAHPEYIGRMAASKVLERIKDPSQPHEFTLYETTLIIRDST